MRRDGHEDLRHANLAGQSVNDDRDAVAGIVDKQLLASRVRLPHGHRHRLRRIDRAAEPRVAVAARVRDDVFVPQDQKGDVLALQFAMHGSPVRSSMRLRWLPCAYPTAGVKASSSATSFMASGNGQKRPRGLEPVSRLPRTGRTRRCQAGGRSHAVDTDDAQPNNLARHGASIIRSGWYRSPLGSLGDLIRLNRRSSPIHERPRAGSSHGKDHLGIRGGIIPLRGAASSRNWGMASSESASLRSSTVSRRQQVQRRSSCPELLLVLAEPKTAKPPADIHHAAPHWLGRMIAQTRRRCPAARSAAWRLALKTALICGMLAARPRRIE